MSSSLLGKLNHRISDNVAQVMSQWLDDQEILSFIKTIKDWQKKVALSSIRLPNFAAYSTEWSVDKVSLVLVPLVASTGVVVSKISEPFSLLSSAWRRTFCNLSNFNSHSNILKSIPGFQTSLDPKEIKNQLFRVGAALFSPPKQMASFFKRISMLKGTISWQDIHDSLLGCFMSSILLCGVDGASFDIKAGEGSFFKNSQDARNFALSLKNACDLA